MNTTEHALDFLTAVDPAGSFVALAEIVYQEADPEALAAIHAWLAQPQIPEERLKAWRGLRPQAKSEIFPQSPHLETLAGAAFLKATDVLRQKGMPTKEAIRKRLSNAPSKVARIEGDFVAELLLTTEARTKGNRALAQQVKKAAKELAQHRKRLEALHPATRATCRVFGFEAPLWACIAGAVLLIAIKI